MLLLVFSACSLGGSTECRSGGRLKTYFGVEVREYCGAARATVEGFPHRGFTGEQVRIGGHFDRGECDQSSDYLAVRIGAVRADGGYSFNHNFFELKVGDYLGEAMTPTGTMVDGPARAGVLRIQLEQEHLQDQVVRVTLAEDQTQGTYENELINGWFRCN